MARIHNLSSKLTLNTRDFASKMDKARQRTKRFGAGMARVGAKVAKFGAAATAVGVAGLSVMVKKQMSAIDATAKMSAQLGTSTEELIGLRHAAELTGAGAKKLDAGMQSLAKRLGQGAQKGTGPAVDAMEALGLNIDEVVQMRPGEQFRTIAESVSQIENPTKRAGIAAQLFSKQNMDLVNTLALGREGLNETAKEAEKLGLTFSRMDAAKVEAANDSLTRLSALGTGLAQSLTIQLAPYIDAAATKLVNMGKSGEGMGQRILDATEWVTKGIAKVIDQVVKVGTPVAKVGQFIQKIQLGIVKGIIQLSSVFREAVEKLLRMAARAAEYIPFISDGMASGLRAAADGVGFVDDMGDKLVGGINKLQSFQASALQSMEAFAQQDVEGKVGAFFDDIRAKSEASAKAIAKNGEAKRNAEQASKALAEKLEREAEQREKINSELDKIDQRLERFGMSDIQIKLADLSELGATNAQLEEARQKLEKIKAMEDRKGRQEEISGTIADLEKQVRRFGLSDEEKKLLDLEALGASAEQTERAKAAMERLNRLERQQGAGPQDRGESALVRSGSAEAQRLAFRAQNNMRGTKDDVPQKQLNAQTQMVQELRDIRRNQSNGDGNTWEL